MSPNVHAKVLPYSTRTLWLIQKGGREGLFHAKSWLNSRHHFDARGSPSVQTHLHTEGSEGLHKAASAFTSANLIIYRHYTCCLCFLKTQCFLKWLKLLFYCHTSITKQPNRMLTGIWICVEVSKQVLCLMTAFSIVTKSCCCFGVLIFNDGHMFPW